MATDLTFSIAAIDKATTTFVKLAGQVDRLSDRLDALDRKRANPEVDIDTSKAQAELDKLQAEAEKSATDRSRETGSLMAAGIALGLSTAAPVVAGALVGGVSLGFVGMAAVVQKNNKAVQSSFVALKNQVVTEMTDATNQAVPFLVAGGHALQQEFANLGPELHQAFAFAGPDVAILTKGVDNFADNSMPSMVTAMRNSQPIVSGLSSLMADFGTTTGTILDGASSQSETFGRDISELGTTVEDLGSITAAVLPGLASGFGGAVGSVNATLTALRPIAPALGTIAGQAAPVVGMFKLFGVAAGPIDALGVKLDDTGSKMVNLQGNSSKLGSTVSGVGKTLVGAGRALPLIGAAVGFVTTVVADSDQKFLTWQNDILQGGAEATTAMKQFQNQVAFMPGSFQKLLDGLTPLQKAQADYNILVDAFGPKSKQATDAQRNLATANEVDELSQKRLSLAMLSTNEQLAQQQSLMLASVNAGLAFQSSVLGVKQAQTDYAKAVHDSGGKSDAAKQAFLGLQQAQESEAESAVNAAAASHANASASDQAKAKSDALAASVLGMAAAAKGHMSPALQQMVAGLTDAQVSAFAATEKVKGTTQAIVDVHGKDVKINVASNGEAVATNSQRAINGVTGKSVSVVAVDHVTSTVNEILRFNSGKTIHVNVATGQISALGLQHRATGGPVLAGQPYIVGERHAEVFVPDVDGRIEPNVVGGQAAAIAAGGALMIKPPRGFDSLPAPLPLTNLASAAPTRTAVQEDKLLGKLDDLLQAIQNYPPVNVYGAPGQSVDQIANEVLRRIQFHGRL